MKTIAVMTLLLACASCKEIWNTLDLDGKQAAEAKAEKARQEAELAKPDYIPPECRHPYGLYRVHSFFTWNYPKCDEVGASMFANDRVVWWGGTNEWGPDHNATRVRKRGCEYEYTGKGFVGTETRGWADKGKSGQIPVPQISYNGTWTVPVPAWHITCQATGIEWFTKEEK